MLNGKQKMDDDKEINVSRTRRDKEAGDGGSPESGAKSRKNQNPANFSFSAQVDTCIKTMWKLRKKLGTVLQDWLVKDEIELAATPLQPLHWKENI